MMALTLGRWAKGNHNFSWFICAGSDFANSSKTNPGLIIQQGQGYDGQFFYRYACDPLNFNKEAFGINVDVPAYRMQRIAYPFFAWALAFGNPNWVPYTLIFINILAFLGILFFTKKFITAVKGNECYAYLPFLLCGLFMSFSRDLSEVLELFFFTATVYYFTITRLSHFILFGALTLLTRETSLIAIFPLFFFKTIQIFNSRGRAVKILALNIPFVLFAVWKYIVLQSVPEGGIGQGYQHLGIPFKGIIDGFTINFNFSSSKNTFEFLFWIAFFIWNVFLVFIVLKSFRFSDILNKIPNAALPCIYLIWLLLAICFTHTVYSDDWGFLRIFSLWNMVGFLFIIQAQVKIPKVFILFSILMLTLTFARLVTRV